MSATTSQATFSKLGADNRPRNDSEHAVRIKGLQLLNVFLSKCSTQLLDSSGLSSVFEDAVFPSLYFLPGLDSEPESTWLLNEAYRVMLQVANAKPLIHKRRLLDRIIRDGILATYNHASKSPIAVQTLMRNLAMTVSDLGIYRGASSHRIRSGKAIRHRAVVRFNGCYGGSERYTVLLLAEDR
ncbi:hypothetical protein CDD80_1529 [Ophiocordyceps camponoti-rufipedis]|uniref:Uncharacterized protein n=1 Tax=Ophiocordyceps camponoti-rufipedis TaxID=2004952 RepID=A0A2C5Z8U6_9HYPO|nr:hypothetical protein CDD80_1529 [Ophiocordyceps camponoti-rufipedis]